MHATLVARPFWLGFGMVVVLLTVTGPMDTRADFGLLPRAVYWAGLSLATYFTAIPIVVWTSETLATRVKPLTADAIGGLVAGLPISMLVYVINSHIAGNGSGGWPSFLRLLVICPIISMAVVSLRHLVMHNRPTAPLAPDTAQDPLLKRLPLHLRGPVLCLQAQDHYVEVTTQKGRDLVLIRLADAISELPGRDGIQPHRSWWVARDAIAQTDANSLTLINGQNAPISRANKRAVQAWINGAAH